MYINLFKRKIYLIHLVLIVFILFALIYVTKGSIESANIARNGIITKGVITEIRISGGKGVKDYYYKFMYNGIIYKNYTIHLSKNVGDSVNVLFIKNDPTKNKIEERLLSTYAYFLKRNTNLQKINSINSK